jgi:hypothetical protein
MESFTAELSSIYIEENILTKIKLNSLIWQNSIVPELDVPTW